MTCFCCGKGVVNERTTDAAAHLCPLCYLKWTVGTEQYEHGLLRPALDAFRSRVGRVA